MRLYSTIILLSVLSFGVFAQDDYSAAFEQEQEEQKTTQGSEYFPKAGDFGIGFDASPFLNYLGNAFNGSSNNQLNLGDNTLYFRYFLSDDAALRLALRINSEKDVNNFYVTDDAAFMENPLSQNQVEDRRIELSNNYDLKLGYQMFRGKNRLRGFFGGDLFFGYAKYSEEFEYGNQMTVLNPAPSTAAYSGSAAQRPLTRNYGAEVSLGLGAFTGAEYYLMPGVCLGAEMGLVYGQTIGSQANESYETMVETIYFTGDREVSPGDRSRSLQTTFPSAYGNLYLMIHF